MLLAVSGERTCVTDQGEDSLAAPCSRKAVRLRRVRENRDGGDRFGSCPVLYRISGH